MELKSNPEADRKTIAVLEAAVASMRLLALRWRQSAQSSIDVDEYGPEKIQWALRNWHALRSAAEGGSVCYEGGAGGGGTGGRLGLACLLADIARATDAALGAYVHWRAVQRIYAQQEREVPWERLQLHIREGRALEPPPPWPWSYQFAIEAIARQLGWRGYAETTDAAA
jgi:hypothetical protein